MPYLSTKEYDVIVIGGGHAGCEASLASARRGAKTLLVTGNVDQIGAMSCNPAIGGLGKGHIVREIDALGGEMAKNIDATGIQFRKLNTTKGTAVQGTRAQADKYLYRDRMRLVCQQQSGLDIKQGLVKRIKVKSGKVVGVELTSGDCYSGLSVIVTTGTFLKGLCHVGMKSFAAGRAGDEASNDLSGSLKNDCGLHLMRLKTGTVPRLDGLTIDFSSLEEQKGDFPLPQFSFSGSAERQKQVSCFITYTNEKTHDIIRGNMHLSPLFQGVIEGVGPRYCPSIEDKVTRFADKDRHQVFLEPEGLSTTEFYPNGLSTSLPLEVQVDFIRSIPGCENAEIVRPGYAVEYDAVNPIQIFGSYQTKTVEGLFLAGQINGTTGYEEAAGQGLMAAINAVQYVRGDQAILLDRSQAYIGVMTDDLVTKGVGGEPYRMFTSRAEYRLILREDNADIRLRDLGRQFGLVDDDTYHAFLEKKEKLDRLKSYSENLQLKQSDKMLADIFSEISKKRPERISLRQLVKWPEVQASTLKKIWGDLDLDFDFCPELISSFLSEVKYEGYISRYETQIRKMSHYDKVKIPLDLEYSQMESLSSEVKEKLEKFRPETLGQALRIPGITPAAISHLEVILSQRV